MGRLGFQAVASGGSYGAALGFAVRARTPRVAMPGVRAMATQRASGGCGAGLRFAARAVRARRRLRCSVAERVVRAGSAGDASGSRGTGERGSGDYDALSRGGGERRRGAERASGVTDERRKKGKLAGGSRLSAARVGR
jgi:hypothetical protein